MSEVAVRPAMSNARLGVVLMLVGMLAFALNDAMGKWLVASYSVGQVVLIRSIVAVLVLAPFLWQRGFSQQVLKVERPWLQFARVVFSTAEVFAFYYAVAFLPLADVMTYWLAAPIYVAAVSPFLLGEKVGWRRWTAIAIGFSGVVVALEPSSQALTPPAIVAILGSMAFAFMLVSGRTLRNTPDTTLVFWQIIGAGIAGLASLPYHWQTPELSDLPLIGLLGVVAMAAHMLVNRALKLADAATVAPLQYTMLFWAIVFGALFFGDVPRPMMLVGSVLIVFSGLFIFFREQQLKRQQKGPSGR